ncbi:SMP-30/gluconolactonase/LRE family protein [Nocardia sp. 2]|uniref:SMP-30/gluconolactonase/LRE family protein n=2 Tax=Nocardia acididurans TaxID=2802282 RepID=A0ABS1MEE5_9NOCA|nr:SMP-30/gluconolactonase/LRE family protein [Nocardia acididurans]
MPAPRLLELPGAAPEDVVIGPDGRLLTGTDDGAVLAVDPQTGAVEQIAHTGHRPLGLHAESDGSLLICDAGHGLLRLDKPGGVLEELVTEIDGEPLRFPSNVVAAPDGTIYFSASSRRWPLEQWRGDIMEHSGTGRLLRRTTDGQVDILIDGLDFANGVVLAPDGSHLLVAETGAYRITRYWLTGPQAGSCDRLVENLPGFPDNMLLGSDGLIWVSIPSPRNPLLDRLLPLPGLIRRLAWTIPENLQPQPERTVWAMAFDFDGTLVHDLQREPTDYAMVTSVAEHEGAIYLGSLSESAIAVTHLP